MEVLDGQVDGVQFLIFNLKLLSVADCVILCGTKLQLFGPECDIEFHCHCTPNEPFESKG